MSSYEFDGPPPVTTNRNGKGRGALRVACEDRPGEWATLTCDTHTQAGTRQWYYSRLPGWEATRRGTKVYVRFVGDPA